MNVKAMMGTVGKAAKTVAGKAADLADDGLDLAMMGAAKIEGPTNRLGQRIGDSITSKAYDTMIMNADKSTAKVAAAKFAINNYKAIDGAIGGGIEGAVVGAAGGAIIGGVSGGIDQDETFLGGMAKGAAAGAGLGLAGGGLSGALHKNPGLIVNASNDANIIAARISKWAPEMGDGISRTAKNAASAVSDAVKSSPAGNMVRPGSTFVNDRGVRFGTQIDGQMRFMV